MKSGDYPAVSVGGVKHRSGWYSTKLHLALIALAVLTGVFLAVVRITGSAAGFGEYCIALVTLVATYSGSRVGETFAQRPKQTVIESNTQPPGGS